jgi:transposase
MPRSGARERPTGIVSVAQGRPDIVLFFTGPHHAGENLRTLLQSRSQELPLPIQMCDALSRNMPEDLRVILANCLAHGRRNFVDVVKEFPAEVRYVLECLKKVYQTDAEAKQQHRSPEERLRLHQEQSKPVMDELHRWLKEQFDEKLVEPNGSLGSAISYMLKHWEKLTEILSRVVYGSFQAATPGALIPSIKDVPWRTSGISSEPLSRRHFLEADCVSL